MNRKEDILDTWIMVEHLSEGDINLRDKSIKIFEGLENEDYYTLFLKEIQKKKFAKNQKGGIVVYFDVFKFEEVVGILRNKFQIKPTNEDIRYGDKFSFALYFDKNLNLCGDMTFLTVSAYVRWFSDIPKRDVFKEQEKKFKNKIVQYFEQEGDKQKNINEKINLILKEYNVSIHNCRMRLVNSLETDATNLHSFFVEDLEKAKVIKTDNLEKYLSGEVANRVNLDSKINSSTFNPRVFWDILQPKNYPVARFPGNTEFALSLMQQVAVNLSVGYDSSNIRSVNGPPGTGKTSLLKDIFAELVVEQAFEIVNLPQKTIKGNSNTAYYGNASIGEMPVSIAEKGIVVASSNNGAVQNIVNELPLIKDIDAKLIDELKSADYFTRISNSYVSTKWIEDETGKKKEQMIIKSVPGEDKFWGLFSLEGGKTDNMNNIIMNVKHVFEYLDTEYISKDEVYDEFKKQYNSVDAMRKQLQAHVHKIEQYNSYCHKCEILKGTYGNERVLKEEAVSKFNDECNRRRDEISAYINTLENYKRNIVDKKNNNEKNRSSLELSLRTLEGQKPGIFARRKFKQEHNARIMVLTQQLVTCVQESREVGEAERNVEFKIQEQMKEYDAINVKQQVEQSMFNDWVYAEETKISKLESTCEELKKEINYNLVNVLDMSLDYEKLQVSNPWFNEQYRIAQSKLFIMALKVRKQFLYENKKNIKAATIIWSKQKDYLEKKKIIAEAWNWINMVIPVISSTFASFSRMCINMDAQSLGHLFIDEAGQALPQASVGAIYRSKNVMVVGDPSQIKPVLTLDSNVLSMLGEHFNVSKKYLSDSSSTQTLVDEVSQYGFYKEQDEWIGVPLWVHRRCKDPMFAVSNKISYKGFMVQGNPGDGKVDWYDIRGKAIDKYVREQGEFLIKKINELINVNPKIIDKQEKDIVYVITPFSNVAYQLAKELKQIGFTRYDDHGKPTNIGTVHTFQGKEAPIVFLVLGADETSSGAARWAMDEPNIMNVAATRAKEEFYVIGDKSLYLNLGCDVATDTYQIIERYKEQQ